MKFVSKNGKTYVRHWFKWYCVDAFLVWRLNFKEADEHLEDKEDKGGDDENI